MNQSGTSALEKKRKTRKARLDVKPAKNIAIKQVSEPTIQSNPVKEYQTPTNI